MLFFVLSSHLSELRELIGSLAHKYLFKLGKCCGSGSLGGYPKRNSVEGAEVFLGLKLNETSNLRQTDSIRK